MAEGNSKTAQQVAIELVKAIRAELDAQKALVKSSADPVKTEYTPQQAAQALGQAIRQQIKEYEGELVKMRQREADELSKEEHKKSLFGLASGAPPPAHKSEPSSPKECYECEGSGSVLYGDETCPVCKGKGMSDAQGTQSATSKRNSKKNKPSDTKKAETFIDVKNSNVPGKREVTVGGKGSVLPLDKKPKKQDSEGSGGEVKLGKEALGSTNATGDKPGKPGDKPATSAVATPPKPAALKPTGVPGMKAGSAPKVPEIPKAPGMKKEEMEKVMGMGSAPAAPASKKPKLGIPSNPGNPNAKMNLGNAFGSLNTPAAPAKKEEMCAEDVKKEEMEKMISKPPAAPASSKKPLGIPSNPGNPNAKMNMGNAFGSLNTPPAGPPAPMNTSKSPALAAAAKKSEDAAKIKQHGDTIQAHSPKKPVPMQEETYGASKKPQPK